MSNSPSKFIDIAAWVESETTDPVVQRRRCVTHIVLVVRFFIRVPILQFLMSPFPCCDEVFRIPAPAEGLGIMGIVVGDIIFHCRDARLP